MLTHKVRPNSYIIILCAFNYCSFSPYNTGQVVVLWCPHSQLSHHSTTHLLLHFLTSAISALGHNYSIIIIETIRQTHHSMHNITICFVFCTILLKC